MSQPLDVLGARENVRATVEADPWDVLEELRYEAHLRGLAAAVQEREQALAEYYRMRGELDWMDRTLMHSMSLAKLQR